MMFSEVPNQHYFVATVVAAGGGIKNCLFLKDGKMAARVVIHQRRGEIYAQRGTPTKLNSDHPVTLLDLKES